MQALHSASSPVNRDQSSSRLLPMLAIEGAIGDWIVGAGVTTNARTERLLRRPGTNAPAGDYGTTFEYPRMIPGLVRQPALTYGADSVRPVFERLNAERRLTPERYVLTERGMLTVGTMLSDSGRTRAAGLAALEVASEAYPQSVDILVKLSDAYVASGKRDRAVDAIRRASELAPSDARVVAKRAALGVQ